MAIVHCKEVTNRSAEKDGEGLLKHYVRTFQLLSDVAYEGTKAVLAWAGLPVMYATWEATDAVGIVIDTDAGAIVVSRTAEQTDPNDLHNWTVTIRYAGIDDPTALPAEVEDDQVDYQKSLIDDVKDRPVVNAAGDPFETGVLVDRSRGLLRVSKNLLDGDWNSVEMEDYRDTLNGAAMFVAQFPPGFAAGTLKMRSLTAKRIPYPGNQTFYWRATAVMERNRDGWEVKLRNQGRRCRTVIAGPADREPILKGGLTNKGPFLLDADGLELAAGAPPTTCDFDGYETKDWTPLTWLEF